MGWRWLDKISKKIIMKFFTSQKEFFEKINSEKNKNFENNLCWLVNIFIILKNNWVKISEKEIFDKAIEINAFGENIGWKYGKLIELFNFYWNLSTEGFNPLYIFDARFFHNFRLKKIFKNFENKIFMASVDFWENHLIIIEKIEKNIIFYKSVWTKDKEAKNNWKINFEDFFKIYNKRGILVNKN